MMGQQPRTDSLFYYFRLEDQIPDDHLLKRLDRFIDFGFVRERLRDTYSAMGRPSIDPEVLLRLLLVGYLYGITSERRLMEEVRMHLAYRWFSRLGFEREIPTTPLSPRTGMADSAVQGFSWKFLKRSYDAAWTPGWWKASASPWMGPSSSLLGSDKLYGY